MLWAKVSFMSNMETLIRNHYNKTTSNNRKENQIASYICVVHCRHDQHGLRRFREIFAETSQDTRRFTNFWRIFHVFFAKFRQNYADISWVFRENFASLAKFSRNVLQMFVSVSWKFHEIFAKCSSNVRECFVSVSWDLRKLFYKCTLQMYPRAEVA